MADAVETVHMVRGADYPPPHSADVHPDEVEHYRLGGWMLAPRAANNDTPPSSGTDDEPPTGMESRPQETVKPAPPGKKPK